MSSKKFRKKPVVIEAMLYDGSEQSAQAICNWRDCAQQRDLHGRILIHTLEGDMLASPGDWVIRGVKGEFYPCKPDVFAQCYEELSEVDSVMYDTFDARCEMRWPEGEQ